MIMIAMQIFLHLDQHLVGLITHYGLWIYTFLFLVIFCETGLIIMPFLPGDSLLFIAGAITAGAAGQAAGLNIHLLVLLLCIAAILGDSVNYTIGRQLGYKLFTRSNSKLFRQDYLDRTRAFYEKHGSKTIIIARFIPIIRTFAPFIAGIAQMHYMRFFIFNVIGAVIWIVSFAYAGYFLGNIDWVKKYLNVLIIAIIIISITPAIIAFIRSRVKR
jgi:membrane-associated protein